MSEQNNETVTEGGNENDATDMVARLEAELAKVNAKNRELIGEKQAAKQAALQAQQTAQARELEKAEKEGDITAMKLAHQRELEQLDQSLRALVVDNAIKDALNKYGVKQEYARGATALLKEMTKYEKGVATIDGASIADYTKAFFTSSEGAHYIRARDNSGGGAAGSTTVAAKVEPFNETKYAELRKTDPKSAQAWADATGNSWIYTGKK